MKNCPSNWNHEDLFNEFAKYGTVASAKMSIDANFVSRGFGFVSYETAKAAQKAIKEANGKPHSKLGDEHSDSEKAAENASASEEKKNAEKDELKLIVTEYLSKNERNGSMRKKCSTNLYVKNFPAKEIGEFCEADLL